jgi:hypothetical protein
MHPRDAHTCIDPPRRRAPGAVQDSTCGRSSTPHGCARSLRTKGSRTTCSRESSARATRCPPRPPGTARRGAGAGAGGDARSDRGGRGGRACAVGDGGRGRGGAVWAAERLSSGGGHHGQHRGVHRRARDAPGTGGDVSREHSGHQAAQHHARRRRGARGVLAPPRRRLARRGRKQPRLRGAATGGLWRPGAGGALRADQPARGAAGGHGGVLPTRPPPYCCPYPCPYCTLTPSLPSRRSTRCASLASGSPWRTPRVCRCWRHAPRGGVGRSFTRSCTRSRAPRPRPLQRWSRWAPPLSRRWGPSPRTRGGPPPLARPARGAAPRRGALRWLRARYGRV